MEETIFDSLNAEFYLSSNSKWDILHKLGKKINIDEESTEDCKQKADSGVQLLPRQDVMLFGMLPKMEQRVYSKCRECRLIFNPRDILKHKDCSAKLHQETTHPSLLKKQQKQLAKAKANSNKKPVSGTAVAQSVPPQNSTLSKKLRTPPPIKPKSPISQPPPVPSPLSTPNPLLELKVSVAKVVLPKVPKVTTVTSSNSLSTVTTSSSSEKHHELRVSSVSFSPTTKSGSAHHSPKSVSKSSSHGSHSSSSHRSSSSSKDSHKSTSSRSTESHSSRSASKVSTNESHSLKSAIKTTPMETLHHLPSKSKSTTSEQSLHSSTHLSRSSSKVTSTETHSHSKSSTHSDLNSSTRKSTSPSSTVTPMDTLPPPPSRNSTISTTSPSSHHPSSRHSESRYSSSSRHKKSKKNNSSSSSSSTNPTNTSSTTKGISFDPDVHCGVVEGTKGPCTRSVTCSNHRIQLRKLVPGRSKDIHQLIAERKAAKEKDSKHTTSSSHPGVPNAEARDSTGPSTSYVLMPLVVAKLVSTAGTTESPSTVTTSYVPIMPKVPAGIHTRPLTTSKLSEETIEKEADSPRTVVNGYVNQTTFETSPQDMYMPMSPISVASPVQFVKIGNKMMCLEAPQSAKTPPITKNGPIFIQMPINQPTSNIRTYKSHPKPAKVLTYGTRKMGGAILFSNRRLESQRNAFLSKLRPQVNNKTVNKRSATDKLVTSDNKKLVSEMNGFFLHVDMSDASDSPQSNNLIQDKILLSMK